MRKRWKVQVTQEDIDWGRRNNSFKCVVARAIGRTIEGSCYRDVDLQVVTFSLGDLRYQYRTPWRVVDYIVDFDAGLTITPFEFTLTDPAIYARRQGEAAKLAAKKATSKPTKHRPPRRGRAGREYGRRVLRENQIKYEQQH